MIGYPSITYRYSLRGFRLTDDVFDILATPNWEFRRENIYEQVVKNYESIIIFYFYIYNKELLSVLVLKSVERFNKNKTTYE